MALFDTSGTPKEAETPPAAGGKTGMRCHTVRGKRLFDVRRFNSEAALLESAPWHFQCGTTYHVISGGDCDALTFLRHVVRQQRLDFCLVSSWCYGVWASPDAQRRYRIGQLRTKLEMRQAIIKIAKSGNPAMVKVYQDFTAENAADIPPTVKADGEGGGGFDGI